MLVRSNFVARQPLATHAERAELRGSGLGKGRGVRGSGGRDAGQGIILGTSIRAGLDTDGWIRMAGK